MVMEHRWNARTPVQMDIVIHYPPTHALQGQVVNMSLDGLLVRCRPNDVPLQRVVNIVISAHTATTIQLCYLRALVVRHHDKGLALMFVRTNGSTRALLRRLLQQRDSASLPSSRRQQGARKLQ